MGISMPMPNLLREFGMFHYLTIREDCILFGGEKVVLHFLPHMVSRYVCLDKVFGADHGLVEFLASKRAGHDFVAAHGAKLQKSLVGVVDLSCKVLSAFGWGAFRTIKVDEQNNFMLLEAQRSTFAEEVKARHGPQPEPIDWMLAGLLAGAQEFYTKRKTYAIELNCAAQKDTQRCTFLSTSPEDIVSQTKRFAPEKAKWAADVIVRMQKLEAKVEACT